MSDDIVKRLQEACHDPEGEPLEQDGFSNATIGDIELAIIEITRLRAELATARREGMEEAAKIAADFETAAYQHGNLPANDPHECAAQAAREIAASIRAAAKEGEIFDDGANHASVI